MHSFLTKGLVETHLLWADVEMGYRWVHRAAHLLTNHEKQNALQCRLSDLKAYFCQDFCPSLAPEAERGDFWMKSLLHNVA